MKKIISTLVMLVVLTSILAFPAIAEDSITPYLPLRVVVNGVKINFPDSQPYIDAQGRIQTPARFIGEALGATVSWNPTTKKATFVMGSKKLVLNIGKKEYEANGIKRTMDTTAMLKNGRTFVPARYVAEALGATVEWDNGIRTAYINIQKEAKDPVTGWIKVETDLQYVEYAMSIEWSSDPALLKARYDAAEKMFAARYPADITKKIFALVRTKQTREYEIKRTEFRYNGQLITVLGQDIGVEITVWKKGAH